MHGAAPSHIRPANEKGFRMRIDRAIVGGAVCALCVALAAIAATAQPPGTVKQFGAPVVPMFEGWYRNADGTATILLRAEVLDETGVGGGGFQCCWTSAIVRVTVSP